MACAHVCDGHRKCSPNARRKAACERVRPGLGSLSVLADAFSVNEHPKGFHAMKCSY